MHGDRDVTNDEFSAILPGLLVEFGDSQLRRTDANGLPVYDKRQPLLFVPTGRRYTFSQGQFNYHAANFVFNSAYLLGFDVPVYPRSSRSPAAARSYYNTAETFNALAGSSWDGTDYFHRFFDIVAWPGQAAPLDLRAGDLLLRGPELGAAFGHLAIIADPTLRDLADSFFNDADSLNGRGVHCIEAGLAIRTRADRYGRGLVDASGRLLTTRMVIRFKASAIDRARVAEQMEFDPRFRHMFERAQWSAGEPVLIEPAPWSHGFVSDELHFDEGLSERLSASGDEETGEAFAFLTSSAGEPVASETSGRGGTLAEDRIDPDKWLKLFPDATRNKADFLIDGAEYFASVVRAIETAKTEGHFIYILGWMLDIDFGLAKGKTLFDLLKRAAESKVEVRILIWDNLIPSYAKLHADAIPRLNKLPRTRAFVDEYTFFPQKSKQLIQQIAPYIVQLIQRFGPLAMASGPELEKHFDVPPSYVIYRLLSLISQQTIGAHHEKVVIVKGEDGLIAYCGGIDFNKNRSFSEIFNVMFPVPYYHDTACRLQGPAAHEVLQRFKRRWRNHPTAKSVGLLGENEARPKEGASPFPYAKVVGTYNSLDGSERDRSLRDAYLTIIENAKSYIYIEDQYLVNLDVARALNKKIKEPDFQKLTFAIQDSIETSDLLIPNRKRGEFYAAVIKGATDHQKSKVLIAVIDRTHWQTERYHPGMHAKTLIVDDEIAIIGSANVNQRSFTLDSETSVIVFDNTTKEDANFARRFRIATWKHFLRKPIEPIMYESWWNYPTTIKSGSPEFSILIKYTKDLKDDLDVRIIDLIKKSGVIGAAVGYELSGRNLQVATTALSPQTIPLIFDRVWEAFLDPQAD